MKKRRLVKKIVSRQSSKDKREFRVLRFSLAAAMLAGIVSLSIVGRDVLAQVWSEPTTAPPGANAPAPIWNQNAAAQTGNIWIGGTAKFDAPTAGIGVYGSGGGGVWGQSTVADGYGLIGRGGAVGTHSIGASYGVVGSGTAAGSYGIYGEGVAAGVAGMGTGVGSFGVYGVEASAGGYAGYFSGKVNATGDITQAGVKVCLSDGTNCPSMSGGGGAVLRFTDATFSSAPPSTACSNEYGTNFSNANRADVVANWESYMEGDGVRVLSWIGGAYTSVSGWVGSSAGLFVSTGFSAVAPAACISNGATLRRTNTVYSSTPPATACSSELGSGYENASPAEVAANFKGHLSFNNGTAFFTAWMDGAVPQVVSGSLDGGLRITTTIVGSYSAMCIHK